VPLAEYLLASHARRAGRMIPVLDGAAAERLCAHDWPGNVRELENVIQRALILQSGDTIGAGDVLFDPGAGAGQGAASGGAPEAVGEDSGGLEADLREREYSAIRRALDEAPSRKEAATRLGISERTLRYKLARMREEGQAVPA
jgi:two-component system response regulator FlrC